MKSSFALTLVFSSAILGACATNSTSPTVTETGASSSATDQASSAAQTTEQRTTAISIPAARYPAELQRECKGGLVNFAFSVAEDGHVYDVTITSTPNKNLDRLVLETVSAQWRFKPYDAGTPKTFARLQSFMRFDPPCTSEH